MAKILIVDDEKDICNSLEDVLVKEGYEVEVANSGHEAIKKVKAKEPNLILMDVKLPKMNGIETLKEIRKINKDIPVAMITAYEDIDLAQEALRLGAYDYIKKPFDVHYLLASILSKVFPLDDKNNKNT